MIQNRILEGGVPPSVVQLDGTRLAVFLILHNRGNQP